MTPVTDPRLVERLNALDTLAPSDDGGNGAEPLRNQGQPLQKVTDPAILAKLNGQAQQPQQPLSTTERTAFDQGMQGATFNLADEAGSFLGALGAKGSDLFRSKDNELFPNQGMGDLYNEAQTASKERLAGQERDHPLLSLTSQIGGGLLTGLAGGTTKAGQAVANSVRTGLLPNATSLAGRTANLATKVGQGATLGAASGGLAGAGSADQGERLQGAESGAITGGLIGGAIPAAGAALGKLRGANVAQTTSDDIRKAAGAVYDTAAQKGGVLTPQFTDRFITSVQGLTPQTAAGKLLAGDTPFTKLTEKIGLLKGKPISLAEAQEIDEFLGDTVDEFTDKVTGRLDKQGKKILDIQSSLRNMIDSAAPADVVGTKEGFEALKEGRGLWSKAARLRDIEKIITRAELMDNPATGIKTGFRNLYSNPGRLKGFSTEEKALIKRAADSGAVTDTLRTLGSRLIPAITAASGGSLGTTMAATAATTASRSLASKMQVNKAVKVANKIAGQVKTPAQPMLNYSGMANSIQQMNMLNALMRNQSGVRP